MRIRACIAATAGLALTAGLLPAAAQPADDGGGESHPGRGHGPPDQPGRPDDPGRRD